MIKNVRREPAPREARGRAHEAAIKAQPLHLTRMRTCCVCKTVYKLACYAWRCERWHWND